jgi:hypothetical protein
VSTHRSFVDYVTAKFSSYSFEVSDNTFIEICKIWAVLLSYDLMTSLLR